MNIVLKRDRNKMNIDMIYMIVGLLIILSILLKRLLEKKLEERVRIEFANTSNGVVLNDGSIHHPQLRLQIAGKEICDNEIIFLHRLYWLNYFFMCLIFVIGCLSMFYKYNNKAPVKNKTSVQSILNASRNNGKV